jgi:hypothetical protein
MYLPVEGCEERYLELLLLIRCFTGIFSRFSFVPGEECSEGRFPEQTLNA